VFAAPRAVRLLPRLVAGSRPPGLAVLRSRSPIVDVVVGVSLFL